MLLVIALRRRARNDGLPSWGVAARAAKAVGEGEIVFAEGYICQGTRMSTPTFTYSHPGDSVWWGYRATGFCCAVCQSVSVSSGIYFQPPFDFLRGKSRNFRPICQNNRPKICCSDET